MEGSAGRVRLKRVPAREGGFHREKGASSQGFQHKKGFQQGFRQVLYQPIHLHSVLFEAKVHVLTQLIQRDELVAEPQARGDSAASMVDNVSTRGRPVTW